MGNKFVLPLEMIPPVIDILNAKRFDIAQRFSFFDLIFNLFV